MVWRCAIHNTNIFWPGANIGLVQHQECLSAPLHFKCATTPRRLRASLHCFLPHWGASIKRGVSPTTAQSASLLPQLVGMCHQFCHDVDEIFWPQPFRLLKLGHVTGGGCMSPTWVGRVSDLAKMSFIKSVKTWIILLYIWLHSILLRVTSPQMPNILMTNYVWIASTLKSLDEIASNYARIKDMNWRWLLLEISWSTNW